MADDKNKMAGQGQPIPYREDRGAHLGDPSQPGVMGDETEEQNLNQPGDPKARISKQEVEAAFRQQGGSTGNKTPER
jgi:hypothetical protein